MKKCKGHNCPSCIGRKFWHTDLSMDKCNGKKEQLCGECE